MSPDYYREALEIRRQDVAAATLAAGLYGSGPMADYYREHAEYCQRGVEYLERKLFAARRLTLVQGGLS